MSKLFVRCCGDTTVEDNIWFDEDEPCFRYAGNDEPFIYCPWCGILLDTNLEMSEGHDE